MSTDKKKNLSREDAAELYKDVRKAMGAMQSRKAGKAEEVTPEMKEIAKKIAQGISQGMKRDTQKPTPEMKSYAKAETADAIDRMHIEKQLAKPKAMQGTITAVGAVVTFAAIKVLFSILEVTGVFSVPQAQASMSTPGSFAGAPAQKFSKEEVRILTQLDERRAQLEDRSKQLDDRESEYAKRDEEFTLKLTQLRDLTTALKMEREKGEKKKNTQLDQLANVYGSMAPQEAATLMEQLDVAIALDLLSRMPEKRIGQILALMHPERALTMTRMLSGKAER